MLQKIKRDYQFLDTTTMNEPYTYQQSSEACSLNRTESDPVLDLDSIKQSSLQSLFISFLPSFLFPI